MDRTDRWSRVLVAVGLVAVAIGTIDPLEGSIVLLLGIAVLALGAWLSVSRHRRLLYWSLALTAIGVGGLWGLSAVGGLGGRTGRSYWWAILLLPYPIGWITGLVGGIRRVREAFRPAAPSGM
jgi:hypothetical protein